MYTQICTFAFVHNLMYNILRTGIRAASLQTPGRAAPRPGTLPDWSVTHIRVGPPVEGPPAPGRPADGGDHTGGGGGRFERVT